MDEHFFQPKFNVDSPYLGDYFGLWMILEDSFQSLVSQVNGTNLHVHLQSPDVKNAVKERDGSRYIVSNSDPSMAMFSLQGPMMKAVPSMANGASYVRFRQQLNAARRDPDIKSAILFMDTPGGTAMGNEDAAVAVRKFAAEKPIYAYTEDLTASAGVSIASQATKRFANNSTAYYGAMGTYSVVQDLSGMAEKLGVKVHVIRAGEFKGSATPGTEISEEQLSEFNRVVNRVNDNYLDLIATGLKKPVQEIRALADGRVIMASDAVSAGLIDGVQSIEATKEQLRRATSTTTQVSMRSTNQMEPTSDSSPQAASLSELKKTFPNSTADWRETQLEAGNTISQSAIEYAKFVETKAEAEKKQHAEELEKAKQEARSSSPNAVSSAGHQPLTADNIGQDFAETTGDPVNDFESLVMEQMQASPQMSRRDAVKSVKRRNPELSKEYLLATNQTKYAKRTLDERFDSLNV